MKSNIDEFAQIVDKIYGVFLDCNMGFDYAQKHLNGLQSKFGFDRDEFDKRGFEYGIGNPNKNRRDQHSTTIGILRNRMSKDGSNTTFLAGMCVVAIYQYWEDKFRSAIGIELKVDRLESDLFGDLRHLRRSIIHRAGSGVSEVERCKVLSGFRKDESIVIDSLKFKRIIDLINAECNVWRKLRDEIK